MKKSTAIILLAAAGLLIAAGVALGVTQGWGSGESQDYQYVTDADTALDIRAELSAADVFVYDAYDDVLRVELYDAPRVTVSGEKGAVTLREKSGGVHWRLFGREESRVVLWVPVGLRGSIRVETASGDIDVNSLKGAELTLSLSTASGDVGIYDAEASAAEIHTVSGNIWMGTNDLPGVSAVSTSGDISVYGFPCDKLELSTVSGDVWCSLPGAAEDYSVSVSTVSGEVYGVHHSHGSGGKEVSVSTVSGDVSLQYEN